MSPCVEVLHRHRHLWYIVHRRGWVDVDRFRSLPSTDKRETSESETGSTVAPPAGLGGGDWIGSWQVAVDLRCGDARAGLRGLLQKRGSATRGTDGLTRKKQQKRRRDAGMSVLPGMGLSSPMKRPVFLLQFRPQGARLRPGLGCVSPSSRHGDRKQHGPVPGLSGT